MNKNICIKKEFQIPGTKIILEKGDKLQIKEAISQAAISRMNGLVNLKSLKSLIEEGNLIIKDLEEEGFSKTEIKEFLLYKLNLSKY